MTILNIIFEFCVGGSVGSVKLTKINHFERANYYIDKNIEVHLRYSKAFIGFGAMYVLTNQKPDASTNQI